MPLPIGGTSELDGRERQPPAIAQEREFIARLRDALASLPPEQAEACCLRFLEEFSYREIAEELRVTVNQVGVLLHRAKAALQTHLAEFAPDPASLNVRQGEI